MCEERKVELGAKEVIIFFYYETVVLACMVKPKFGPY